MILLFADDAVLIGKTIEGLSRLYGAFRSFCVQHHMKISKEKTKAMCIRV